MTDFQWVARDAALVHAAGQMIAEVSRVEPYVGLPPEPSQGEVDAWSRRMAEGIGSGRVHLLVGAEDGRAVATAALTTAITPNQRHVAELTAGAIHPERRRHGLVTAAFSHVVERCEELGVELLRLDVRAGIPAERVWRGLGFREYGRLDDYGRAGGQSYGGVYMAQPVKDLKRVITHP